jgi:hypothetical protein
MSATRQQQLCALRDVVSTGTQAMFAAAVNRLDGNRFWCPVCQKNQSKPGAVAPWIGPSATVICVYIVCRRCERLFSRPNLVDQVERNLIGRYPHIAGALPENYFGCSSDIDLS